MGMTKSERKQKLMERLQELKQPEEALYRNGISFIAGVDEVGRGPLAGPVVAAAAVLPREFSVLGVDDSKKLSEKKRNELDILIKEQAIAYGIGIIDNAKIDEVNILEATKLAMRQAIEKADEMLAEKTGETIGHVLFDAMTIKEVERPQTSIIKGDATSISIAAASIIAKVARDRMMVDYHRIYPDYAFDSNKGYGTKAHYEGIDKEGMCPIHRRSFLKNYECK